MDAFTVKEEKATSEVIFSYNTGEKAEMEKLFFLKAWFLTIFLPPISITK